MTEMDFIQKNQELEQRRIQNENEKPKINFSKMFPVPEMITVDYVCERHGKVQCEVFSFNGVGEGYCPICKQELDRQIFEEQQRKMDEEARIKFENDKKSKNIEKEYWGKTFDDFEIFCDSQKQALDAVKRMVEKQNGKVVLLGENGSGKTMLGSIAVDKLGGKILSMYEITTMIRQSYTNKAERTELEIVSELASIPMLVIDEIGRTKGSDAELNWLSYILDKRHTRNLPFMLLTNTHLSKDCENGGCSKCFENYFDCDILSRLRQNSKIITLKDAPDYRARRK